MSEDILALEDQNKHFVNTMGRSLHWDAMLSPIPLGIGVLADIMLVATRTPDISLQSTGANFKYLKYPGSFRASLFQLSNTGYSAFLQAHTNMDRIRLYMKTLPYFLQRILAILTSKRPKLINQALPLNLARIRDSTQRSVNLSQEVVTNFRHVMNVTLEIMMGVTGAKGRHEEQWSNATREQEILTGKIEHIKNILEIFAQKTERSEKTIDVASNTLYETLEKLPSGWEIFSMNLVQGLVDIFSPKRILTGKSFGVGGIDVTLFDDHLNSSKVLNLTDPCVENFSSIHNLTSVAKELLKLAENNYTIFLPQKPFNPQEYLSRLQDAGRNDTGCPQMAQLAQTAMSIVENVVQHLKADHFNQTQALTDKIRKLYKQAETLYNKTTESLKSERDGKSTKDWENEMPTSGRVSDNFIANLKLVIAKAQDDLSTAYNSLNQSREQAAAANNEYIAALVELQRANFTAMTHLNASQYLKEGLTVFSHMKEQWTGLSLYVETILILVYVVVEPNVKRIVETMEATREFPETFLKRTQDFHNPLLKVHETLQYVHTMTETYTKVSRQYIMPQMAELDLMMTFQLEPTGVTLAQMRHALLEACKRDAEQIKELVLAEKLAFLMETESRMRNITEKYTLLFKELENEDKESENTIELVDDFA